MIRVEVKPELLRWTRRRAGMEVDELAHKFARYREWEKGEAQPTLKQLEKLAKTTHTAVGYLFLPKPPDDSLPIPDLRTMGGKPMKKPSPDLLDTMHLCQQRQDWYRDFCRMEGSEPLAFVGSASPADDIEAVATDIRTALHLDLEERRTLRTWTEALRRFVEATESLGVLVMMSGIVGSNTHRKLNPDEFRGFALADDLAPLIFVNGADTKAGQMFTLAHELAHVWLGQTALSDSRPDALPTHDVEAWCNRVAAELLVPLDVLRKEYRKGEPLPDALNRLARHFKVSTLVILRRVHDADHLTRHAFRRAYNAELERLKTIPRGSGGEFYRTQTSRVGRRFARAVIVSTLEGGTSFTESFRLLGFRKMRTFDELARRLGVAV